MSTSRLEKFIYAICSMEVSDLPAPLSRIEILWNCLITGETPDFEPQSRNEQYLMAMLGLYELENLPTPISRGEKLLYKIAVGETDLSDVPAYLSRYEELLKYLIENGGVGDFEYILQTLNQRLSTLYSTKERPVKSAILKGCTGYRDNDTGEILETFEEGRNLELVSVKMPVLTTTGKNLFNNKILTDYIIGEKDGGYIIDCLKLSKQPYILEKPLTGTFTFTYTTKEETGGKNPRFVFYFSDGTELESYTGKSSNEYTTHSVIINNKTITKIGSTYSSYKNIKWIVKKDSIQLEQITEATLYEPYKSNILSTSEDVELRGIGEVQDTLDCLTGEVTEHIGEVVLDGSEKWIRRTTEDSKDGFEDTICFYHRTTNMSEEYGVTPQVLCDKFKYVGSGYNRTGESISSYKDIKYGNRDIFIRIKRERLETEDLDGFKKWLKTNILTVQYPIEKVVKTVDLTTVDQDGQPTQLKTFNDITHVELSSEGLIPEVELEVATKINETLLTMSPQHHDISETQNKLGQTIDEQTENTDAAMLATTEIYEQTL